MVKIPGNACEELELHSVYHDRKPSTKRKLHNELIYDPLTVFHDTTEEMDTNEVQALYGILDKNRDEQVTVEAIVRALMVDMHKNSGEHLCVLSIAR